jgi:6-phosphogluconolactonase/glucosamine-6-phosphate isomerase/deaminase
LAPRVDSAEIDPLEPQRLTHTRIPTLVFESSIDASKYVAVAIAELIRRNNMRHKPTVLGLATGATPVALYAELVRMHREEQLDFSRVITFNLDEYYPMSATDPNSYHEFMRVHLFDHINIPRENIHIPDGSIPLDRVESYCREYEQLIREEFSGLKKLFDQLKSQEITPHSMDILSIGMSSDYSIAIEEGSTLVRIGSNIFGERNT